MMPFLEAGAALNLWFQGLGGWLEGPMRLFSFMGSEEFFLLILPLLYWCVSADLGMRVGMILLITNGLNAIFKLAFHLPRPYWVNPEVKAFAAESSFGLPSGHAQIATGVWGMLAYRLRRAWIWAAAGLVVLMIGLSRLYLGVHFPLDVAVGWLIGGLVLWLFVRYWDAAAAWLGRMPLGEQVLVAFGVSLFMILLGALPLMFWSGWALPEAWAANITRAFPDEALPVPESLSGLVSAAGTLFGLATGIAWLSKLGGYDAGGTLLQRVLRYLLGLLGVLALWYGLGLLFPRGETFAAYFPRYFRYSLVGLWVSAAAPLLFIRLGLARPARR